MKFNILILAILTTCSGVYGQGWQQVYEDENTSIGQDALQTDDGGYMTIGTYSLPTGAIRDYTRLIKTDANGNLQWQHILFEGEIRNDRPKSITKADDGTFYALATTQGPNVSERNQMWLIHFDVSGDTLWTQTYSSDTLEIYASALDILPNGSLILASNINSDNNLQGAYLIQVDENGEKEWERTHLWPDDVDYKALESLIAISGGGFIGVGHWNTPGLGHMVRFDSEGEIIWNDTYSFTSGNYLWDVKEAPNGDLVACGGANGFVGVSPEALRVDPDGNVVWHQIYSYNSIKPVAMIIAPDGGYVMTGSLDDYWWYPEALRGFFMKIDEDGNEVWMNITEEEPGGYNRLASIAGTSDGGYIAAGEKGWKHQLMKIDGAGNLYSNQIKGFVHFDENNNCEPDTVEPALEGFILDVQSEDQSYYVSTDEAGYFELEVDTGSYNISVINPNSYWQSCDDIFVEILQFYDTISVELLSQSVVNCPLMTVDVSTPFLRRCFDNTYTVQYCNEGTVTEEMLSIDVQLDTFLNLISSEIPATDLGDNRYRFEVGDVSFNSCESFQFVVNLDCEGTVLGQTHCVEAVVNSDSCGSSLPLSIIEIESACEGDSVVFVIQNIGDEDMQVPHHYIVIEDDVMYSPVPYDLNAGEFLRIPMAADGATYRMEAKRFPDTFSDDYVSETREGCNSNGNGSIGFVNQFPLFTGSPSEAIECQQSIGAYDPNDKRAMPVGFGENHFIKPNTPLDYHIRFQNTGTDTAFTVVIRDTLSAYLDRSSIRVGAASHDFKWALSGQGILTFTFDNIMLPDSNINEPASHGFIKFHIEPLADLPLETRIENRAAIYFDFNEPIITNTAFHIINENFIEIINSTNTNGNPAIINVEAYPNPTSLMLRMRVSGIPVNQGNLELFDAQGSIVYRQIFTSDQFDVDVSDLPQGVYFYQLMMNKKRLGSGRIIIH